MSMSNRRYDAQISLYAQGRPPAPEADSAFGVEYDLAPAATRKLDAENAFASDDAEIGTALHELTVAHPRIWPHYIDDPEANAVGWTSRASRRVLDSFNTPHDEFYRNH